MDHALPRDLWWVLTDRVLNDFVDETFMRLGQTCKGLYEIVMSPRRYRPNLVEGVGVVEGGDETWAIFGRLNRLYQLWGSNGGLRLDDATYEALCDFLDFRYGCTLLWRYCMTDGALGPRQAAMIGSGHELVDAIPFGLEAQLIEWNLFGFLREHLARSGYATVDQLLTQRSVDLRNELKDVIERTTNRWAIRVVLDHGLSVKLGPSQRLEVLLDDQPEA